MLQIRTLARQREEKVGELVLGAARGALPPPHPDQWLPKAEQQRHDNEVGHLCFVVVVALLRDSMVRRTSTELA